jgi:hypothetical protein
LDTYASFLGETVALETAVRDTEPELSSSAKAM